jgi:HSP20 family protein
MQLVKYNPFRELQKMEQDLDKLWQNGWGILPTLGETSTMDMYEEGGNLIAEVSLPNFKKNEVKVTADDGVLEISAEHKEEEEKKGKRQYYFRESSNSYFRRVTLPDGVKTDKTDAELKNGILKISIPMTKPTTKNPKGVSVK